MENEYEIAVVRFDDPTGHGGWHKESRSPLGPDRCLSVGLVRRRTREHILLAQTVAAPDNVDNEILIPRSCIRSMEIIAKIRTDEAEEKVEVRTQGVEAKKGR